MSRIDGKVSEAVASQFYQEPLSLQEQSDAQLVGTDMNSALRGWTESVAWVPTGTLTPDGNGLISSCPVVWPNGAVGVFNAVRDGNLAVSSYTLTYVGPPAKTITQPTLTRNGSGVITNKPALIIS